jgi:hypothetical protein
MNVQSYFEDAVEVKPNMEQEAKVHYTGRSKSDVNTILMQVYLYNRHHYHHLSCQVGLRSVLIFQKVCCHFVLELLHYYICI